MTSNVFYVNHTNLAEEWLCKCARVSNKQNEDNKATYPQLIRYMWDHEHWSPFDMVDMTLEIYTTRAIAPQILRHGKGFYFQEFSQRYSNVDKLGRIESPQLRAQDPKNRQNSTQDLAQKIGKPKMNDLNHKVAAHIEAAERLYKELIINGVAKESARFILPLAAPTRLYMKGTMRSWIIYIRTRTHESTQLEHRALASAAQDIFCEKFPLTAKAMGWYTPDLVVNELISSDEVEVTTDQELLDQLMHRHRAQPQSQSLQSDH